LAKTLVKDGDKREYITTLGTHPDTATSIRVGGSDDVFSGFLPNIDIWRWDGEIHLEFAFQLMNVTTQVENFADGTVEMTVGDFTYRAYVLPDSDNVLELEIDVARKQALPDPHITLAVKYTPGLEWRQIRPLTQEEIDGGAGYADVRSHRQGGHCLPV